MEQEKENLFKGKFDLSKVTFKGSDWFHDPSGEELEIIREEEEKPKREK